MSTLHKKTHAKAPGKLMIAGEWSVLTLGNPSIVSAINMFARVTVSFSNEWELSARDIGEIQKSFEFSPKIFYSKNTFTDPLVFVRFALTVSLIYAKEIGADTHPLSVSVRTDFPRITINGSEEKVGFGSSAAVTVAVVAAVLAQFDVSCEKETLFKLSAIAHSWAQGGSGSGYDVACSVFGGMLVYTRFDDGWLRKTIRTTPIYDLVHMKWPGLAVGRVNYPSGLVILPCFVGYHASTAAMIAQMNRFKAAKSSLYDAIISKLAVTTELVVYSLSKGEKQTFIHGLSTVRDVLRELQRLSGVELETLELKKVCDIAEAHEFSAKISGAGGGDSGIALGFDANKVKTITKFWEESGLYPQNVSLCQGGVSIK